MAGTQMFQLGIKHTIPTCQLADARKASILISSELLALPSLYAISPEFPRSPVIFPSKTLHYNATFPPLEYALCSPGCKVHAHVQQIHLQDLLLLGYGQPSISITRLLLVPLSSNPTFPPHSNTMLSPHLAAAATAWSFHLILHKPKGASQVSGWREMLRLLVAIPPTSAVQESQASALQTSSQYYG